MNAEYYISPNAISITPNAVDGNPDFVGISVVGGTAIRVKNTLTALDGSKVNVGYSADLSYRTWTLTGGDTYVGNDSNKILYIYARLDGSDNGSTGIVMLSSLNHDVKEADFLYIKLGTLSPPNSSNKRVLSSWDTGELDTNQGINNEKSGDFDRAFDLAGNKITPKLPFNGLSLSENSVLNFGSGASITMEGTTINNIKKNITAFASWASENAIATTQSIKAFVESIFLRKDQDEETTHKLTMQSSCTKTKHQVFDSIEMGDPSDDTKKYVQNVKGSKLYWNGSGWCFDTDYLNVTKKAVFTELEIEKVSHIGGQQILTACSCKVDHVVHTISSSIHYYHVFFRKTDADGRVITNDWKVGDLAYCQSFNVGSDTTPNAASRYYWARVVSVDNPPSGTTLQDMDGEAFVSADYYCIRFRYAGSSLYTDIPSSNETTPSAITGKTNCDIPIKGDNIVLFGHYKTSTETQAEAEARQGATLLAGAGKWGTALIMWKGIGATSGKPFELPEPVVEIGPKRVRITADEMRLASNGVLELSSNQLLCTNAEGDKTAWLDELGNFTTTGIQSQLMQRVNDAVSFLERFIFIPNNVTINPNDAKTYKYDSSNWKTFEHPSIWLYKEEYKVAKNTSLDDSVITTAIAPLSDTDLTYGEYEADNRGSKIHCCLDMRNASGVIEMNWLPKKTTGYTTGADMIGIYLPYFVNYGYDIKDGWIISYLRTPTRMNGDIEFISLKQLKSLIGRKFMLINNTQDYIKVQYNDKFADRVILRPDDYVTFEFVGDAESCATELKYYDIMGNLRTRTEVNLGKYMWQPVPDESFININEDSLDDNNYGKSYVI